MATIQTIADATSTQINPDLSQEFRAALIQRPILRYLSVGQPVHGPTFQWPEETREAPSTTLASNYTAAGTMAVADGSKLAEGDLIHVEGHNDTNHVRIVYRVTGISTNDLTLTAVNGADTSLTKATPGQRVIIIRPAKDNAESATGGTVEPSLKTSYLQLHQVDLELGEKAIRAARGGQFQGIDDLVLRGLEQKFDELTWSLYHSVMYGVGAAETSTVAASTKSFTQMINTTSAANRVDAEAAALDESMINDLVEKLVLRGMPDGERRVLVMHPVNARALSALRHEKVSYTTDANRFGGGVSVYISEIPGAGEMEIVADPNMERDMVLLISPRWAELVPAIGQPLASLVDSRLPGQYGRKLTLRAELGLKVMYATSFHGCIVDIDPAAEPAT